MVANHDRLKKCYYRDIPLWLARYREKFVSGEGSQSDLRFDEDCGAQGLSSQEKGAVPVDGPAETDDSHAVQVRSPQRTSSKALSLAG